MSGSDSFLIAGLGGIPSLPEPEEEVVPVAAPAPTPGTWGDVGNAALQSGMSSGAAMVGGVPAAIAGLGARALDSAATNIDETVRAQPTVFDRIEAGERVAAVEDPIGYEALWASDPERAREFRRDYEARMQTRATPRASGLGQAAEALRENVARPAQAFVDGGDRLARETFPVDPAAESGFAVRTARALGSLGPAVAVGAAAGPLGAFGAIGGQAYATTYREAMERFGRDGVPQEEAEARAFDAAATNALVQAGVMAVPVARAVEGLAPGMRHGFLRTLQAYAAHGVEFAGGNAVGRLLENYIARETFDPQRQVLDHVEEGLGPDLAAGLIFRGGGAAARAAARRAPSASPEVVRTAGEVEWRFREAQDGEAAPEGRAAAERAVEDFAAAVRLPGEVRTRVLDRIPDGEGEAVDARYQPMARLIDVALDTRPEVAASRVFHEATHATYDLLPPSQRDTLDRAADRWLAQEADPARLRPGADGALPAEVRTNADYVAWLNGVKGARGAPDVRRLMRTEAVAHLGELHLQRALEERPGVLRALDRMVDYSSRLGSALRGQGFTSADQVFRAMSEGRGAPRREAEPARAEVDPFEAVPEFMSAREDGRAMRPMEGLPEMEVAPIEGIAGLPDILARRTAASEWVARLRDEVNARGGIPSEALGGASVRISERAPGKISSHLGDGTLARLAALPEIVRRGTLLAPPAPSNRAGMTEVAHIGANVRGEDGSVQPMRVTVRRAADGQWVYDFGGVRGEGAAGRSGASSPAGKAGRRSQAEDQPAATPNVADGPARIKGEGEDTQFSRRDPPRDGPQEANPYYRNQLPGTYSAVERAIERMPQVRAPASQFAAALRNMPGIKPEEMRWLGLDRWLAEAGDRPLRREEVLDYVRANSLGVRDIQLGGARPEPDPAAVRDRFVDEGTPLVEVLRREDETGAPYFVLSLRDGLEPNGLAAEAFRAALNANHAAAQANGGSGHRSFEAAESALQHELRAAAEDRLARGSPESLNRALDIWLGDGFGRSNLSPEAEATMRSQAADRLAGMWDVVEAGPGQWQIRRGSAPSAWSPHATANRLFDTQAEAEAARVRYAALDAEGALLERVRDLMGDEPQRADARYPGYAERGDMAQYGEVLITLPRERIPGLQGEEVDGRNRYGIHHPSEITGPAQLPVAHARYSERTDADGRPVFFIEEIQSDYHQKGREVGYRDPGVPDALMQASNQATEVLRDAIARREEARTASRVVLDELTDVLDRLVDADPRVLALRDEIAGAWTRRAADRLVNLETEVRDGLRDHPEVAAVRERVAPAVVAFNTAVERAREAGRAQDAADERLRQGGQGVPDAPFRTTWPALALKRMMAMAVERGADRVAWTSGVMQSRRYAPEAGGVVGIAWDPASGKVHYRRNADQGEHSMDAGRTVEELRRAIGPELADRLAAAEPGSAEAFTGYFRRPPQVGDQARAIDLTGDPNLASLRPHFAGGSKRDAGMASFYDGRLPQEAAALVKRLGGRVQTTRINTTPPGYPPRWETVWSVDITPAMREAVEAGGFPLFSRREQAGEGEMRASPAPRFLGRPAAPPVRLPSTSSSSAQEPERMFSGGLVRGYAEGGEVDAPGAMMPPAAPEPMPAPAAMPPAQAPPAAPKAGLGRSQDPATTGAVQALQMWRAAGAMLEAGH